MNIESRLAALTALRMRTAASMEAAAAAEATREEVDYLTSRINLLEERDAIRRQLEQREQARATTAPSPRLSDGNRNQQN